MCKVNNYTHQLVGWNRTRDWCAYTAKVRAIDDALRRAPAGDWVAWVDLDVQ